MSLKKTVLITGASSGIGKAAAGVFAQRGWNVIATMRAPQGETELAAPHDTPHAAPHDTLVAALDVRDVASIRSAVEAGIARFGRIDALVNNAGFGLAGVFEGTPPEKIREQFDVNVFGVMDVTRALLPHFRRNRGGVIINVSSRAGLVGLPLSSLYCASKYALEGFSEALAFELASQNIIVKLVEPGGGVSDANFAARAAAESARNAAIPDYDGFISRAAAANAAIAARRMVTSAEVAELIHAAATDGTRRLRYVIGEDTGNFLKARSEMSEEDFNAFMRGRFE